jgi:Cdc6-like AAA superfamily ATPase
MQISGRPLLANQVDAPLYVERGIETKILTVARRGLNALVIGDAGSGKTSLLHRLEWQLHQENFSVVFVDGRRSDELNEILDRLRIQLGIKWPPTFLSTIAALNLQIDGVQPPRSAPQAEQTLKLLIDTMSADKRWIVLLDSPERNIARTLFGSLRDAVWQLPISWIVTADSSASDAFRRPPADAFFELVERLGGVSESEAREILGRREVSANNMANFVSSKSTTPRIVLDHARRSMFEPTTPGESQKSEIEFHRRLKDISRAAAMLASELRGQGAVSASDKDIQQRMGWTRERLTQVLRELETAGLARATEAADGKPGRPRRFYEILLSP